jgi:hypothetical protein
MLELEDEFEGMDFCVGMMTTGGEYSSKHAMLASGPAVKDLLGSLFSRLTGICRAQET